MERRRGLWAFLAVILKKAPIEGRFNPAVLTQTGRGLAQRVFG
jgi:hypothetical protein